MKKLMLIIGIMISLISVSAYADRTTKKIEVCTTHDESASKLGTRSPMRLPIIEVIYDSSINLIEIVSDIDCDATVYIYDVTGNIIATSDSLDTLLYVPDSISSGFYLKIESELWYASAYIAM